MKMNSRVSRIEQVKRQKICIILVLLTLFFILILCYFRENVKKRQIEITQEEYKTLQEITIGAIGTCTLGDSRGSSKEGSFSQKYMEVEDTSYFFKMVYDELSKCNIALTNLEGDLSEEEHAEIKYPIKGKSEYVEILKQGALGVVNLANSRSHDYGKDGYYDTSLVLNHAGLLTFGCNGVQREHNKKLNNGLPILHKVPPKRDYGWYFCIMAEKGGTSHGGLTEKLSLFFHAKKQEVNAYGR